MATVIEVKRMHEPVSTASVFSYLASIGLILGSVFDFLNNNALAFGAIFGAVTCWINYKAKSAMLRQFRDNGMRRRKTDFVDD